MYVCVCMNMLTLIINQYLVNEQCAIWRLFITTSINNEGDGCIFLGA